MLKVLFSFKSKYAGVNSPKSDKSARINTEDEENTMHICRHESGDIIKTEKPK
jgi:hypothetical protein